MEPVGSGNGRKKEEDFGGLVGGRFLTCWRSWMEKKRPPGLKEILLQHFPQLALPSFLLLPLSLIYPPPPPPLLSLLIQLRSYLLLFQQAPCYCPGWKDLVKHAIVVAIFIVKNILLLLLFSFSNMLFVQAGKIMANQMNQSFAFS